MRKTILFLHCCIFQSTHPSWGATERTGSDVTFSEISIHAPIVGCDAKAVIFGITAMLFQSTHPSWGATLVERLNFRVRVFQSTHPSWGATNSVNLAKTFQSDFNPRTHRGVRLIDAGFNPLQEIYFNPRTHRGVRPIRRKRNVKRRKISIHAPIVGCDPVSF